MFEWIKRMIGKPSSSGPNWPSLHFPRVKSREDAEKLADKIFDSCLQQGRLEDIVSLDGRTIQEARDAHRERSVRMHFPPAQETSSGATPGTSHEHAEKIVDRMIAMGYLKYADGEESDTLRRQIIHNVAKNGLFQCDLVDDTENELLYWPDKRQYLADNEDLAGGAIGYHVALMKDILAREGVTAPDVEDEVDSKRLVVRVNGSPRCIYEFGDDPGLNTWGLAHKGLMQIVNGLLEQAGSRERLYGSYHANDGRVVLLTDKMFDYLHSVKDVLDADWLV